MPRLVLFPGLGVDGRLYDPQRAVAEIEVPPWPKVIPDEPLSDYARRMAANVRSQPPFFLGGVSIGAMIALEASRYLQSEGVFLISGCTTWHSLPLWLRGVCNLARVTPRPLFHPLYHFVPLALKILGEATTREQAHRLKTMFLENDPALVQWGLPALSKWTFDATPTVPIYSIHGAADRCIPVKNVTPDAVVPGGGHLINLSHANAVNDFLADRMSRPPVRSPLPVYPRGEG